MPDPAPDSRLDLNYTTVVVASEKPGGAASSLHNPTTTTMPIHRCEALVEVALRYSIPIIEDDAYGMLPAAVPPPLADLAPELTDYITGFSKCLGAGLRAAFVRTPGEASANRLAGVLRATSVMGSPLAATILADGVEEGLAAEAVRAMRDECTWRMQALGEALGDRSPRYHPHGFHAWIPCLRSRVRAT